MTEKQADLVALGERYLYPNYRQPPFILVRGRGDEVWDAAGKRYLDLYAGIAVSIVGHCHPRMVEALRAQAGELIHLSNYFYNEPNIRLAAKLCELTGLDRAFFCNSGAEANEAMLKMARHHFHLKGEDARVRVVAFESSFHGRTLGALSATGQAKYREGFGPLSPTSHVPYGDIDAVRAQMGSDVAAILFEPIQGEGGVRAAPDGFIRSLRELADEHGALLLADEVQTGIGRTGTFLATAHSGVEPDAVALAKALGGGFPIGAMVCKEHLSAALPPGSHGSTFGGNPLASATALAVLEIVESEGLIARAAELGGYLSELLADLAKKHPRFIGEVRGFGLLQAVALKEGVDARALLGALRDAGLLLTVASGTALRFSPSLTVAREHLAEGVGIVDKVLGGWS